MGFGIAALGYIALVTDIIGGGIIAWPIIAYGFNKASRLNERFYWAAIIALCMIPHSFLIMFNQFGLYPDTLPFFRTSYSVYYGLFFIFHWAAFSGAKEIYAAAKATKYENRAIMRIYMTAVYVVWVMIIFLFNDISTAAVGAFLFVYKYIVLLFNFSYIYDCFVRITTKSEMKKAEKFYDDALKKKKEREARNK